MTEFSSAFGERISNFLDYRTARGYKRETYLRHFIKFDLWCIENHPAQTELSRELVLDWINDTTSSSYNTAQRVASMRQFARYLCAVGEEAYILPEKYTPLKSRAAAYLFTDMELTALFSAIDQLPPTKKEPFLNEMAPTLYRLIYTCGLRPNEGENCWQKTSILKPARFSLRIPNATKNALLLCRMICSLLPADMNSEEGYFVVKIHTSFHLQMVER